MSILTSASIHAWIRENQIKNEKGDPIEFGSHMFLWDIYADRSDNIVVMKPAQVGLSTLQILRNHFDAKRDKLDIIYTLPTDGDVNVFVSGKVNRIIANNPTMLADVADKDSIEQKQIGQSYEYFRGTFTKKAAIMISADRVVHDEVDSSKLAVIPDFQARMQHSKHKQTHVFSHPSVPNKGVHQYFLQSDQKELFITCPSCHKKQTLTWDVENPSKMSIDIARRQFVCKKCGYILSAADRAFGEWVPRKTSEKPKFSGYHITLLMDPKITAGEICDKWQEVVEGRQTADFFYNKVLGLPFAGGGNTVDEATITSAWTSEPNAYKSRLIIGVDTGIALRYVIGNKQGLVGFGEMKDYMPDEANKLDMSETLEYFLKKFDNSVMVIDQGGDIIGSRKLRQKYPGRVFLCHYAADRKTMQLIRWGEKDESGNVLADRNRMIQVVIGEFKDAKIKLFNGTRSSWWDYWLHWSHIYRVWKEDSLGVPRATWMRDGRDDWVHATVYWYIGLQRFGDGGAIIGANISPEPNSYVLNADHTVTFNPEEMFKRTGQIYAEDDDVDNDWRSV